MNLEKSLEHAAEHLPQGWTVHVSVENGAGWVRAERPDGTMVEMHEDETDLAEQVCAAVRLAHDELAADALSQENIMDINEFADALARLSIHKIGIVEAATLLACRDGLTTDEVAERFRIPKSVAIGRVAVLLRKGLVRSLYEEEGARKIVPTADGKAIIETANPTTK